MMQRISLILLICLLALSSCENEDFPTGSDTLLFGSFAGHCLGNCFTAFELDNSAVQSDDAEGHFTFDQYEFQASRTLSKEAFTEARAISSSLPSELINTEKKSYGCPDCADQGGFFVIFTIDNEQQMIIIDTANTDDQSVAIISFKKKLAAFIDKYRDQ